MGPDGWSWFLLNSELLLYNRRSNIRRILFGQPYDVSPPSYLMYARDAIFDIKAGRVRTVPFDIANWILPLWPFRQALFFFCDN